VTGVVEREKEQSRLAEKADKSKLICDRKRLIWVVNVHSLTGTWVVEGVWCSNRSIEKGHSFIPKLQCSYLSSELKKTGRRESHRRKATCVLLNSKEQRITTSSKPTLASRLWKLYLDLLSILLGEWNTSRATQSSESRKRTLWLEVTIAGTGSAFNESIVCIVHCWA